MQARSTYNRTPVSQTWLTRSKTYLPGITNGNAEASAREIAERFSRTNLRTYNGNGFFNQVLRTLLASRFLVEDCSGPDLTQKFIFALTKIRESLEKLKTVSEQYRKTIDPRMEGLFFQFIESCIHSLRSGKTIVSKDPDEIIVTSLNNKTPSTTDSQYLHQYLLSVASIFRDLTVDEERALFCDASIDDHKPFFYLLASTFQTIDSLNNNEELTSIEDRTYRTIMYYTAILADLILL
jgi:hypothetical protein